MMRGNEVLAFFFFFLFLRTEVLLMLNREITEKKLNYYLGVDRFTL